MPRGDDLRAPGAPKKKSMFKYIIEKAGDLDWLALGPFLLFFFFFIAVTIYALKKRSGYIEKMSNLPLED